MCICCFISRINKELALVGASTYIVYLLSLTPSTDLFYDVCQRGQSVSFLKRLTTIVSIRKGLKFLKLEARIEITF